MRKQISVVLAFCFAMIGFGFAVNAGQAQELLIRGQIQPEDGTEIEISAPISLLEILKAPVPGPHPIDREKLSRLVDDLHGDFASMVGQEIIQVDSEDVEIRFWVDKVNEDHPEEANFLKVEVDPADEDEPEVKICIPKTMFFLASFVGNHVLETQGQQIFEMMKKHMPKHPMMKHVPHSAPQKPCPAAPKKQRMEKPKPDPKKLKKEIMKRVMKELEEELREIQDEN